MIQTEAEVGTHQKPELPLKKYMHMTDGVGRSGLIAFPYTPIPQWPFFQARNYGYITLDEYFSYPEQRLALVYHDLAHEASGRVIMRQLMEIRGDNGFYLARKSHVHFQVENFEWKRTVIRSGEQNG